MIKEEKDKLRVELIKCILSNTDINAKSIYDGYESDKAERLSRFVLGVAEKVILEIERKELPPRQSLTGVC